MLRVGCPMWANRAWVGTFLPTATKPGEELLAYAHALTAVEGNTTFYALPDERTVARWVEQTPDDFRFVCKLPREITHERRLRNVASELDEALDRLRGLGSRLGPVTIQLPASFGPDDLPALRAFLETVPTDVRWAVEVRHPSFFDGTPPGRALNALLHEHDADRVILDSRALFAGPATTREEIEAFERKPRLPVRPTATGRSPIVRFIGQTDPEASPRYWRPWVERVARWLGEGREPFVFLHTPDNEASPQLARRFHDEVRALVPGLPPLPEPLPLGWAGDQATLF